MITRIFESHMSESDKARRKRQGKPTSIKEVLTKYMVEPALSGKKLSFNNLPKKVLSEINEIILLDRKAGNMTDLIMDEMIQLTINRQYRDSTFAGAARFLGYNVTKKVNDFSWKQLKRLPSGRKAAQVFREKIMPILLSSNGESIEEYKKEIKELIEKAQGEN